MIHHILVWVGIAIAVLAGVFLSLRRSPPVDVILITVDTLRADHLGAYGYARQTSPNFDAFAKESVLFKNTYSQSSETNPSLSSLMTSALPMETRVLSNRYKVPDGAPTLAKILGEHGYRTGAFVSNFSLHLGSGFEQGFEMYDDQMDDWSRTNWEGMERLAPKTTAAALKWLAGHKQEKVFLWVHYMDPHYPYIPPAPYNSMFVGQPLGPDRWVRFNKEDTGVGGLVPSAQLGDHHELQWYIAQYDGEIRYFDESLGIFLQSLRAQGLMDRSLVIIAGDHGEGMGEHDYYFAHHEFLYRELIHVPLLVRFPDKRRAGEVISYPVANVDILPTILETLQIALPKTIRGRHLLSADARDIYAVSFYRGVKSTLMSEGSKLIENADHVELYDIAHDPDEQVNLAATPSAKDSQKIETLRARLDDLNTDDRLVLGSPILWNVNADMLRKMKALGYVQ